MWKSQGFSGFGFKVEETVGKSRLKVWIRGTCGEKKALDLAKSK